MTDDADKRVQRSPSDVLVRQFDPSKPDPRYTVRDGATQQETLAEEKRIDDQTWDARKRLEPRIVQKVWEDWHEAQIVNHQAAPTNEPDACERDAEEKSRQDLARAIMNGVNECLGASQGIKPWKCIPNGYGTGFVLTVKDRVGRRYDVELDYEAMGGIMAQSGERSFRALLEVICAAIIEKRDEWFARMQ